MDDSSIVVTDDVAEEYLLMDDVVGESSLGVEPREINCAPHIGMEFDILDDVYGFYNNYGRSVDFSIRIYGTE